MIRIHILTITALLLFVMSGTLSCSFVLTQPDEEIPIPITPTTVYNTAKLGMAGLQLAKPEIAAIVCIAAEEAAWPLLEGATAGTIHLRDEVINILCMAADEAGVKDEWLVAIGPARELLGEGFDPQIVTKQEYLDLLKAFVGGIMDACDNTETHKPE